MMELLQVHKKYRDSLRKINTLEDEISRMKETAGCDCSSLRSRIDYMDILRKEQNFEKLKRLKIDINVN